MSVTINMVKELRERSAAGMMDCKKALEECNGDMDKAIDWLRQKGLSQVAKRASRAATEGRVSLRTSADDKIAMLTEVRCETDFVSRGEKFQAFADFVADTAFEKNPPSPEDLRALVEEEFQRNRGNAALKQIMQYYAQSEPGAESNELHSIIGTTVADISPELESYYSQYFADRAAIVALNTKYNAVFGELNRQADELEAKIKSEGPAIQAELANYEADRQQLELDIQTFNARAQSGGFTAQSAFNVARNALTTRLSSMNARQQAVNARVASYNDLIAQLNALAIRVDQLNASINGASAASGL